MGKAESNQVQPIVRLLGAPALQSGDDLESVRGQQGDLLSMLAARHPHPVRADALIEAIWPGTAPKSADTGLRVIAHRLRDRLHGLSIPFEHGGYRLELNATGLDMFIFEDLVANASAAQQLGDHDAALASLTDALDLWRGDAFQSHAESDIVRGRATALEEARRQAEEHLVEILLESGRPDDAATWAGRYAEAEPLREQRWEHLMLALYRTGRQTEALRAGDRARTLLREEVGVSPGPSLLQLETDILAHNARITGPPDAADVGAHALVDDPIASIVPVTSTSFVGRSAELDRLDTLVEQARVLVVTGAPGIGKSRLVEHYARSSAQTSVLWFSVSQTEDEGLVSLVAQRLGIHHDPNGVRAEDVAPVLASDGALIIFDNADDVIDAACELAASLCARNDRVRVVLTCREVPSQAWSVFRVEALDADDAHQLFLERAVEPHLSDDDVTDLIDRTGGNPLHIEITAQGLDGAAPGDVETLLTTVLAEPTASPNHPHLLLRRSYMWSRNRLSPEDQAIHDATVMLADRFTVDDAAAIHRVDRSQAMARLASLCRHGLLSTEAQRNQTVYRHPMVLRSLARAELERKGALEATADRQVDFCLTEVRRSTSDLFGSSESDAVRRLNQLDPQCVLAYLALIGDGDARRAAELVRSLWHHSFLRQRFDRLHWPAEVADLDGASDLDDHHELLGLAAFSAWARNDLTACHKFADRCDKATASGGHDVPLSALRARFNAAIYDGADEADQAVLLLRLAEATEERGTLWERADLAVNLTLGLAQVGQLREASTSAKRAVDLAQQTDNPSAIAWATYATGWAELQLDAPDAPRSFLASARMASSVENRWVKALAVAGLATHALRRERYAQARSLLIGVISEAERSHAHAQIIRACKEAVIALHASGDPSRAAHLVAHLELLGVGHPLLPVEQRRFEDVCASLDLRAEVVTGDPMQTVGPKARALLAG